MNTIAQIDDLSFEYPQAEVLTKFSARVPAGLTMLIGDEGCGKTTLIRLLAGALPLQSGEITIGSISLKRDADAYRRLVYWADPDSDVFDQLTALDFLAQLRSLRPGFPSDYDPRLVHLVEGLSLGQHLHKPLYTLSTGTKRKIWLLGALTCNAVLTLLDDPLAALDKPSAQFVLHELANAARANNRAFVVAQYEPLADWVPPVHLIRMASRH